VEIGAISRLRDVLDNLTANAVLKLDIGRMFGAANVVPSTAHISALLGASDITKTAASSVFGTMFASDAASSSIAQLVSGPAWLPETATLLHPFFAEDRARILDLSAHIAGVMPKFDFKVVIPELQWPLALGSEAWDLAARVAPPTPDAAALWRLRDAGRTTLGMTTAGLVLSGRGEDWDDDELEEDDELVAGPGDARQRLLAELRHLDSNLVNRLEGAWERVSRAGPDAASQAANSLVELITWTLRRAATDQEVLAWHAETGRSADELHAGKPTRALRIRFIVRGRPDAAAAEMYVRAMTDLLTLLQGHKHGSSDQQLVAVGRLLPTVEAHLSFLLL